MRRVFPVSIVICLLAFIGFAHGQNIGWLNGKNMLVINDCDTAVPDEIYNGKLISEWIDECASQTKYRGGYASCIVKLSHRLQKSGIISGKQKQAIQKCAIRRKKSTILYNGLIYTMEDEHRTANAVLIVGNRIKAIGSFNKLRARAGRNAELIDLKGHVVFPGFLDPHTHLFTLENGQNVHIFFARRTS